MYVIEIHTILGRFLLMLFVHRAGNILLCTFNSTVGKTIIAIKIACVYTAMSEILGLSATMISGQHINSF